MNVLDQFSLKTKVVLVTGGEGLLGRCICETVRELGGTAISLDVKPSAEQVLDITDAKAVQAFGETAKIDILVNCAAGNQKPLQDAGAGFADDLNIALVGAFNMTATFGSKMSAAGAGVILNIGSDLSLIGPDPSLYPIGTMKPVGYSVAKHGIVGMTRYFAVMWGGRVRVNCLCPGCIDQGQRVPRTPMRRLARLDEMKGPVAFLLSEASSYVTGAVLSVDGGRTCW
jgi:NAD(P)-dependent dehydrogenase (short-subunit alcohol dehydrogenase family)